MRRSVTAFVVGGFLALLAGCVAGEESDSATQDLTGGVANARGCKVQSAYLDASLEDFTTVAFARLPAALKTRAMKAWGNDPFESTSTFTVPSIGKVFVLEQASANGSTIEFYDSNSEAVATATTKGSWLTFRLPYAPPTAGGDGGASSSAALQCGSGSDAGFPSDGGRPDAASDGGIRDASPPRDASIRDASPWGSDASYSDAG